MGEINVNYSYPDNPDFDYVAMMERINLDEEKNEDLYRGKGFIVSSPKKSIKKDIKDPDGIFSTRFGQKLEDLNPYMDRYKCDCGYMRSRINNGLECPNCHTLVKYVGDDYSYFGWKVLKKHYIIHPNLYKSIDFFFGPGQKSDKEKRSKLYNIINYAGKTDIDGHEADIEETPPDQPYYGLGMMDFYTKFDEIMDYYLTKYPKKQEYYDDIMANRDKVFIQSIPVFTTHLRPSDITDSSLFYEPINGIYNMINKFVHEINKDKTRMDNKKKLKNDLLFKLQQEYMNLYVEIEAILSGKKGKLRSLVGGRSNFSSRAIIVQDPSLRIDQITLPYTELVITQQQKIINILHKSYNISFNEAYKIWEKAKVKKDERVAEIINALIKSTPEGLPVLLNRNPTIALGGILQMFCIGMTDTLTIGIPLQILKFLAADFDGDSLNIFHIINNAFFMRAFQVFNPRNSMYISRNNGTFNLDACVQRDTIINANTLLYLGRDNYNKEQLNNCRRLKQKCKEYYCS